MAVTLRSGHATGYKSGRSRRMPTTPPPPQQLPSPKPDSDDECGHADHDDKLSDNPDYIALVLSQRGLTKSCRSLRQQISQLGRWLTRVEHASTKREVIKVYMEAMKRKQDRIAVMTAPTVEWGKYNEQWGKKVGDGIRGAQEKHVHFKHVQMFAGKQARL